MSRYSWVITKDFTECDDNNYIVPDPFVIGPRGATKNMEEIVKTGEQFRMYDDDKKLYYEGFITGKYEGFEPLDDYGMPNAGATEIQYFKDGEWNTL